MLEGYKYLRPNYPNLNSLVKAFNINSKYYY